MADRRLRRPGPIERREGYRLWIGGPVPRGYAAITFGSLIIVRRGCENDDRLLRHELVHVEQYRRHGMVGFLARYLRDYSQLRLRGHRHGEAYRRIPFEVEAESRCGEDPGPPGA